MVATPNRSVSEVAKGLHITEKKRPLNSMYVPHQQQQQQELNNPSSSSYPTTNEMMAYYQNLVQKQQQDVVAEDDTISTSTSSANDSSDSTLPIMKDQDNDNCNVDDDYDDYDSEDEELSCSETSYESAEETKIAQAMVREAFGSTVKRNHSSPSLDQLFRQQEEHMNKRARVDESIPTTTTTSTGNKPSSVVQYRMRLSSSAPNLPNLILTRSVDTAVIAQNAAAAMSSYNQHHDSSEYGTSRAKIAKPKKSIMKPEDYLRELISKHDNIDKDAVKLYPAKSLSNFFTELTEESIAAYDFELVRVVREENIERLQEMMNEEGRTMHAGNRFGETILHAACRRGSVRVLKFLLFQAKVPVRVCCDYLRTPLHDAVWTTDINFEIIDILLDICPDFLYITDKRGFTPLSYAPPETYQRWNQFLQQLGAENLRPKFLK